MSVFLRSHHPCILPDTLLTSLHFSLALPRYTNLIGNGSDGFADTPHLSLPLAVVTDPEDPRFDLEKLIAKWEADSQ